MLSLRRLINFWRDGGRKQFRLVPTDAWDQEPKPLVVKTPTVVGRSEIADTRVTDPWVSRVHCELYERNGVLMVRDLESRHGVFVNGQRASHAELHNGDLLCLGVSRFRVEYNEPAPSAASAVENENRLMPG